MADLTTPPGITPTPDRGEPAPAPGIGATVHYVSYGTPGGEYPKACRAAIVTQAGGATIDAEIGLAVFNPGGLFFDQRIWHAIPPDPYAMKGGTWHHRSECPSDQDD